MTEENKSNKSALKQGALGFAITFIVVLTLLMIGRLYHVRDDIFYRDLDTLIILEFIFYTVLGMVSFLLPISVLVMSTVYYRKLTKQGQKTISLKNMLLCSIPILLVCFMWSAVGEPANTLRTAGLLFDIRSHSQGEPFERSDLTGRIKTPMTSSFFQMNSEIDRLRATCASQLDEQLPSDQIIRWQIERAKMVSFPFRVFMLFCMGMFLGVLNRQRKLSTPVLIAFFGIIPISIFVMSRFDNLAQTLVLTPNMAQIQHILALTVLTFGLFLITRERTSDVNYSW